MSDERRATALRYGTAFVATAAAVVVTLICRRVLGQSLSTVYVAAVAATALFAGSGPALLALALCVAFADYLALPPYYAFSVRANDIVRMVFLGLSSLLIIAMAAVRDRAERRLGRSAGRRDDERPQVPAQGLDAAQRAEGRPRDLIEGLDAIVWEADAHPFRVSFVSQRAEEVFGHPLARWTDDPAFRERELVHPGDRLRLAAVCRDAIERGSGYDCEFRAVAADGRVRWMREIVHVTRDARGVARTLAGVLIDVSRPRLAERSLRVQHAVASVLADAGTIAEATPRIMEAICTQLEWEWGALWSVDDQAQVLRFVASWHLPSIVLPAFESASRERTFPSGVGLPGRVWEEGEAAWIRDVEVDENFPRARAAAREGLHGALAFPVLLGGRVLGVIEFFSRVAREPDQSMMGPLAVIGSQIGQFLEQKNAETQRRESLRREQATRAEAEAASRAKDEFLATVSHELRAPLTPILLWTRMLRGGAIDAATRERALQVIESNAKAQAQLVDDLLDVSRIVTGKLRLEVTGVAVPALVEAALEAVRPAAAAKGVILTTALDATVATVAGDAGRLQQVVWNLLANAVKFTPRDGTVEVRLARVDGELELSVRDTGNGISAEFLPHVFERFRQADGASTRVHGGLGLGLAIVRHLVELHGGSVRADSGGEGHGSTFAVRLPLRAPEQPAESAPHADSAGIPGGRLSGRRVLVVDDDADTRQALAAVLGRAGAEVRLAGSAEQAMQVLREWRPHVLVSDVGLPEEDGYALMRRVRALPAADGGDVGAVALTGYARAEDRERGLAAGFHHHLVKPIEPAELIDVVATLAVAAARPGLDLPRVASSRAGGLHAPTSAHDDAALDTTTTPAQGAAALDNAALRDAIARVSHELRQPLAAMRIWLNLLEAEIGDELSPEVRHNLAQIRASVTGMGELITTWVSDQAEQTRP